MAESFQAASLVASPSYPNAVAWSDENLLAVASGHLITILNPAMPFGPRGLITLPASKPFPIGVIERKDLLSGCLLPICLSRDLRPCVRSISWSPVGLAPNSGCMLAVCTTEGQVKIHRFPFCEFSAEWIEVVDISEMLYTYLAGINFGELDVQSSEFSTEHTNQIHAEHGPVDDMPLAVLRKHRKRRLQSTLAIIDNADFAQNENSATTSGEAAPFSCPLLQELALAKKIEPENHGENSSLQIVLVTDPKKKPQKKKEPEKCCLPMVTANQYASRSAMLSSLAVAWSPILQAKTEIGAASPNNLFNFCSILAIGTKSGKVAFWRVHNPRSYSTTYSRDPTAALLIGLLQAHCSWVATIKWTYFVSDASNHQLILTTGSSDGSVKIWLGHIDELLNSTEVSHTSFSLLKEVITINSIPVSLLSVTVQSHHKMLLAVGKGSGSLEVWICDLFGSKFDKAGSYDAHDQIVTGLAWAFDGRCLYSCSQDNSMCSWILDGDNLFKVPFPSNTPGLKGSTDVPDVSDSCFGLAVSPGSLVLAVARSFDVDLLNPMYQARTQKAAVEFFFIGGQKLGTSHNRYPDLKVDNVAGLPEEELISWGVNILWSLNQFADPDRPLVVWDILVALSAFKQSAPKFMEILLLKWLKSSLGFQFDPSSEIGSHELKPCSKISSRQLHLLNIVSRHLLLADVKREQFYKKMHMGEICSAEGDSNLWMELLLKSEEELRARLVGLSFSVIVSELSSNLYKVGCWYPVGLAQMEQWVVLNHDHVKDQLKRLASEIGKLDKSNIHEYVHEEVCNYCEASIPFESPEVAFCQGMQCSNDTTQSHRLARCAVSMKVCPSTPSWFCVCCERCASTLSPTALFKITEFPSDNKFPIDVSAMELFTKPLCPFCGILMCRLQPEFLLSPSPL